MTYTVTITDAQVSADFASVYPDPISFFQSIISDVVNSKRQSDALAQKPVVVPVPEESVTVETVNE